MSDSDIEDIDCDGGESSSSEAVDEEDLASYTAQNPLNDMDG